MSDSSETIHPISSGTAVEVVPGGPVNGHIRPPGSKSLTNRALICAAMADGPSQLRGTLASEDTEVMIEALRSIGVSVELADGGQTVGVARPASPNRTPSTGTRDGAFAPIELYIANSGTSVRFLTSALSALGGRYRLHGVPRMHQRPIGDLVTAIEQVVDGRVLMESPNECPPVVIESNGWSGQDIQVSGSVSSQFLSGLMMAAPISGLNHLRSNGTRIGVLGTLVSRPYVDMTAAVMESFGAEVEVIAGDSKKGESLAVHVGVRPYQGRAYAIEPDASAASYFWASAAIAGGTVRVDGLNRNALQGDVKFCEVLEQMGCLVEYGGDGISVTGRPMRGVDVDMNMISDTVQTLAVVALFAEGPTRVRGVAHNRFKETDRIGDLACELRKLGAVIDEHDDGLTIDASSEKLRGNLLTTYHDHRMAMSLSLAGLRIPEVRILDPACTSKTYPDFFADLERLIGRSHQWHQI